MKITIPRNELREAVAGFSKIVNGKSRSLPILGCVRFEAGKQVTAQATDLDQFATYQFADAQADGKGVMVLALTTLRELIKGSDTDTLVFATDNDQVCIENPVGGHVVRQTVDCMPLADWPPSQAENKTQPAAGFLETYRKLSMFASSDATRRLLNGVCIDVEAKNGGPVMVACDGKRLSRWVIDMPLKKTCVVPISKFLEWAGLTGDERIGTNKTCSWFDVHVGKWIIQIRLVDGVYPNWSQVIPNADDCKPCLTLAEPDIPAFQAFVRSLGSRAESVSIGPSPAQTVKIACTVDGKTRSLDLTGSRYETDYTVLLNGIFLLEAISAGFRVFRNGGPGCPMYAENGTGIHVLMPLRISPPTPVPESAPESQTTTQAPAAEAPNPASTTDTGRVAQEKKEMNEKTESKPETSALEKLQSAYDVAKTKVREAGQALADVADAIKLAAKEDRQRRNEVDTVRAGLQKLQSIRV